MQRRESPGVAPLSRYEALLRVYQSVHSSNALLAEASNLAAGDYIAYRIRLYILLVYTLDAAIRHRVAIQKHFSSVR